MFRCGALNPVTPFGALSLFFLGEDGVSLSEFVTGSQVVGEGCSRVVGVVFVGMTYASQFSVFPEPAGSWNQVSIGTLFGGGSI